MGWFRDFVLVSSGIVSWKILTNFLRSRFGQRQEYSSVLFTNELSGCCMNANDCENQYCMSHVYVAIEKQIESAKQLICVAIYMFTNQRICDAIIRAYNRGVEVRVIVDQNTYGLSSGRVQDLQKAGDSHATTCIRYEVMRQILLSFQEFKSKKIPRILN